ncbi:MFS transporter [Christensenellaceae bacterium OttesenSCG-928-K19]|nr:MFS transporter [Christensenellaceae bacterium OttesenSCG-928-K19]
MDNQQQLEKRKKSIIPDFGGKGWFIILILMFIMFFGLGFQSEGMNTNLGYFSEILGEEVATLQMFNSYAGWVGIIGTFLWGLLSIKIGGKKVLNISLILYAAFIMIWGQMTTVPAYMFALFGVYFCLNGAMSIGLSNLVANWFPLKKGNAMGWVTIGASLSPIMFIPMQLALIGSVGFNMFFIVAGILLVVLWILTLIVKNRPEEWGAYPDNDKNMTPEQAKAILALSQEYKKTSPFTLGRLLRTPQMWFTAIGCAVLLLVPVGFMTTIVARFAAVGVDVMVVVGFISACGVGNLFFSLVTGFVDQRFGTKKATFMCYALYFIALILTCFMGNMTAMWIGSGIIIVVSGGVNNLTASTSIAIFGRFDFAKAFTVISPISVAVRTLGYMMVAPIVAATGSYLYSNIALIVIMVVGLILVAVNKIQPIGRTEEDFERDAAKRAGEAVAE